MRILNSTIILSSSSNNNNSSRKSKSNNNSSISSSSTTRHHSAHNARDTEHNVKLKDKHHYEQCHWSVYYDHEGICIRPN